MTADFPVLRVARRLALWAAVLLSLTGCAVLAPLVPQTYALRTEWPAGVPRQVELTQVPFIPQDDYQCGPAALGMVLAHSGKPLPVQRLVDEVWLPARKGSLQLEMLAAPRRHGRVSYRLEPKYADLLREVAAGNPVVVLQEVGLMPLLPQWHYAVVNGFDYESGTIFLRSGLDLRKKLPFTAFERSWLKGKYWAMVVLPPDRVAASATEERWLDALLGLARGGDVDATIQGYRAALARWPDSLPAAVGLANHLHAKGALDDAGAVLRTALGRHPQSAILLNNLAQTLSDQGRHREALALIERADALQSPFAAEVRSTRELIEGRMRR